MCSACMESGYKPGVTFFIATKCHNQKYKHYGKGMRLFMQVSLMSLSPAYIA